MIQFTPVEKIAIRFTTAHHQAIQRNAEALAGGEIYLDNRITRVERDLAEGLEGVNAQLIGIAADQADATNAAAIPSLINASNRLTANSTATNNALNEILIRIRQLEELAATTISLPATVGAISDTLQVVMGRVSSLSGTLFDPALGGVNENGKRPRADDDRNDPAKHHRVAVDVPAPFAFPTAPPAAPAFAPLAYAAPAFATAAVPSTAAAAPAFPSAPVYTDAPAFAPAYAAAYAAPAAVPPPAAAAPAFAAAAPAFPGAPVFAGAPALAMPTFATTVPALPRVLLPIPATSLPRAPPGGAPRVRVDPAREVLFGPVDWDGNHFNAPRALIASILGTTAMRGVSLKSRKAHDDTFVVLTFEADTVADWFVNAWNLKPRMTFEGCVARKNV
ncbi:hypothetical protein B0H11DRAFT_1983368 [Mycena galericulata]|nr:hypothetical protein B0H11DRAFT_1983368 [Mycena galericulata]